MDNFNIILGFGLSILVLLIVAAILFMMPPSEIKNGSPYPSVNSRIKIINKTGTTWEDIATYDASGNFLILNESVPDKGSFVIEVCSKQTEVFVNQSIGAMLNVNGKVLFENAFYFFNEQQMEYSVYPTSEPCSSYTIYEGNEFGVCSVVTQMQQIPDTHVLREGNLWPVDPILIRNSTDQYMEILVLLYDKDNMIIDGNMDELSGYDASGNFINNTLSVDISRVPEGGYVYIIAGTYDCLTSMSIVKDKGKLYYYYFFGQTENTPHSFQILQTNGSSMPVANIKIMTLQYKYKPSDTIISKLKGKAFPRKSIKANPKI